MDLEGGDPVNAEPVNVAIIGMGQWGRRAHLPAIAALPNVNVSAVVTSRPGEVRPVAEQHGVGRIMRDTRELFDAADELDAVVIATPDDTHHAYTMAALSAGLHVLCEKPLALDVPQAAEMTRALHAAGRVGRMGFLYRHSPVVARIKQLVDDGFIGDLRLFESISVNGQFADPNRELHWKMQRSRANGGVFVEYGSHLIDLALWFGGPIERVVASGVTLVPERPTSDGGRGVVDVDDAASWIALYESGAEGLFRTGWASLPIGGAGVRLYGSTGSLAWQLDPTTRRREALIGSTLDDPTPREMYVFEPEFDPGLDGGPFPLGLLARYNAKLAESFVTDIRTGSVTGSTFDEGLETQRVLAAIRASLDTRQWVAVERPS
jgi:predicted dehydrogenase